MRAQTTLDFAIGMSVFLIAVAFVLTFAPGILEPFETGSQEETVVADRVASQLAQGSLADPEEPYTLLQGCTNDFFNLSADPDPACRYDKTADLTGSDELTDRIGIEDRQRINVTVTGDANGDGTAHTLCYDTDAGAVVEETNGDCDEGADPTADPDVRYSIGDDVPGTGPVVSARRTVSVGGVRGTLVVKVW